MHPQDPQTPPVEAVANTSLSAELPFGQSINLDRARPTSDLPEPPEGTTSTRSFVSRDGEKVYVGQSSVKRDIPKNKLPKFKGTKVSRFLERYEIEFIARGCTEQDMAFYLPTSVKLDWLELVRGLPGYKQRDWHLLKKSMKDTFGDEEKYKFSLNHLRRFVSTQKRKGRPDKLSRVNRVYLKFAEITNYLKDKGIISSQEESRSFLSMLPEDIVEMFYSRRDMRQLVKSTKDADEDDEDGALPDIREILKELQSIFASFAKRGKISKIRGRHQWDSSDSDSSEDDESDYSMPNDSSEDSDSEEEKTYQDKKSRSKTSRSHSRSRTDSHSRKSSKAHKSSKSSDSDRGIERMRMPKMKDEAIHKLLSRFDELQVTVAQLAASQAQTASAAAATAASQTYPRRPSFNIPSGGGRPAFPAQNQNPNVSRWNGPRRDSPPHEANTATYESSFAGTGSNAVPVSNGPSNSWGSRAPPVNNIPYIPPHMRAVNPQFTPQSPTCLWCAGEDGPPHWMYACKSLDEALKSGLVNRPPGGKLLYGTRYIPGKAHPKGMRAWVAEQEEMAKAVARDRNVTFEGVSSNSIEYNPPEISEGQGEYEATHVQVDEYEVNAGKRTRSASTENAPPRKNSRTHRGQESLFEDLGLPKTGNVSDKENDVEMRDPPKRRSPANPKPKLESAVESKADTQSVLEKLLQQEVTISMSTILASSPELAKAMVNECRRKRMPAGNQEVNHVSWTGEEVSEMPQVNLNSYEGSRGTPKAKSYYAGVLAFANVNIEGETIKALLDNGSMICMMQDRVRRRLGLPIRTDGTHRVRMAGGSTETMMGISEDVPVKIGGVTTYVHFFISEGSSNAVLLGQNFLRQVEARFSYHADGSVMMGMTHKGRRITVEVTGKDESRYLAKVPGEIKDYESSAVRLLDIEDTGEAYYCRVCGDDTRDCEVVKRSANRTGLGKTPSSAIVPAVQGTAVSSTGLKVPVYGTRSHTPLAPPKPTSSRSIYKYLDDSSNDEEVVQKASRKVKGKGVDIVKPKKTRSAEKNKKPRKEAGPRKDRQRRKERQESSPSEGSNGSPGAEEKPVESDPPVVVRRSAGNRALDELPPTPAIDALLEHASRIQDNEQAVMEEAERQQALQEVAETRTGPWITTCTPEEAIERAQTMRDEYDRFLTVLFGRKIPVRRLETRKEPEGLQQTLAPAGVTVRKPPKVRECSSMMFTVRTSEPPSQSSKFQNAFTNLQRLGNFQESAETRVATDIQVPSPLTDELEPSYEDWIDDQHRHLFESEAKKSPRTNFRDLCAREGDIIVDESAFDSASTSENSEADLIRELGLQMEGAGLSANFVDLMYEGPGSDEGSLGEENEAISNEFGISEDITYDMLDGLWDHSSDEEMSLGDEINPVSNYSSEGAKGRTQLTNDPLFIDGEWRTFELADTDDEGDVRCDNKFLDHILGDYVDQRVSEELEHAARQRLTKASATQSSGATDGEDVLFTANSVDLLETDGRAKIQFKGEEASLVVAREIRLADTDPDKQTLLEGMTEEEKDQYVLRELRAELKKTFFEVSNARLDKQVAEMEAQATEGMEPAAPSREASAPPSPPPESPPKSPNPSPTPPETETDDSPPGIVAPETKRRGKELKREGAQIWTEGFECGKDATKTTEPRGPQKEDLNAQQVGQTEEGGSAKCEKLTVPFFGATECERDEMYHRLAHTRPAFEIDAGIRFRIKGEDVEPTAEALEARLIIADARASAEGWDCKTLDEKTWHMAEQRCQLAYRRIKFGESHQCSIKDLFEARDLLAEEDDESAFPPGPRPYAAFDPQVMTGMEELEKDRELLQDLRDFVERTYLESNSVQPEGGDMELIKENSEFEVELNAPAVPLDASSNLLGAIGELVSIDDEIEHLSEAASQAPGQRGAMCPWDDWELDEKVAVLAEKRLKLRIQRKRRQEDLLRVHGQAIGIHKRAFARDRMREQMCALGFSPEGDHRELVGLQGFEDPDELQKDQMLLLELKEYVDYIGWGVNSAKQEESMGPEESAPSERSMGGTGETIERTYYEAGAVCLEESTLEPPPARDILRRQMYSAGFFPDTNHLEGLGEKDVRDMTESEKDEVALGELRKFMESSIFESNSMWMEGCDDNESACDPERERTNTPEIRAGSREDERRDDSVSPSAMEWDSSEKVEGGVASPERRTSWPAGEEGSLREDESLVKDYRRNVARTILDIMMNPSDPDFPATNGINNEGYAMDLPPSGTMVRGGGISIVSDYSRVPVDGGEENKGSETTTPTSASPGRPTSTEGRLRYLEQRKEALEQERDSLLRDSTEWRARRLEEVSGSPRERNERTNGCFRCSATGHAEHGQRRMDQLRHQSYERTVLEDKCEAEEAEERTHFRVNSMRLESSTSSGKAQPLAKA
ncbi:hypothetical protein P7C70_g5480, partial [Phenoliferia sp. Uapishka_3]